LPRHLIAMTANPTWQYFREHTCNPTDIFESQVAKWLFCSTVEVKPDELEFPPNYPGIECRPVLTESGWASFQAKYSHDGKQNVAEFDCLRKAYKRKSEGQYQLDIIYCYSSGAATESRKRQEIDQLAEQNGIGLVWRFADQILEQLRYSTDPIVIRAKRRFFEDLPQPTLIIPSKAESPEGIAKYHFSQQATPLIGRNNEIKELSQFLFSEATVSWWGVIGKGGSGKSRLLLDFGQSLSDEWQWGWLDDSTVSKFDFNSWTPNKHTLLIADYVIGQEQEISSLLCALFKLEKKERLQHVVRLLLVERESGQWFKNLKNLNTIRAWVQETLYSNDLLQIHQLEHSALVQLANSLINCRDDLQIEPESLIEKALAMSPEQAPLVMQLLVTSEQIGSMELIDLIREFIERDKFNRWDAAQVDEDVLEVLIITTMCGGIDLNSSRYNLSSTYDYFASFRNFSQYSLVTGEATTPGRLEALEPDLFGELFVLDRLALCLQNPLSGDHKRLLKLAMTVNEGRAVVGFFSKCRNDYPLHSAFSVFSSPPEGKLYDSVWTIPKQNPIGFIWLLIASNTVDAPAISRQHKNSIYVAIVNCQHPMGGGFLFPLEQVAFIRLLSLYSEIKKSQKHIGSLEITDQEVIPLEPTSANLLDQFYPDDYCDDVIADFRQIPEETQFTLLGPHIVRVYHHKLVRFLSNGEAEIQQALSLYKEVLSFLNKKWPNNYPATIIEFHYLSLNFIAALIQLNHSRRQPEVCMQIAEDVNNCIGRISETEINGQRAIMYTAWREQIVTAMTVTASLTRTRNYQYLLNLMDELDRYLCMPSGNNPTSALNYVKASVQLAHGFKSKDDFDAFIAIYNRCLQYSEKFPGIEMAATLGMIHIQLYRNKTEYYSDEEKYKFLEAAIKLAEKFPEDEANLLRSVLMELSSTYHDAMKDGKLEIAYQYFETALSLIQKFEHVQYSPNRKIYCCGLITVGLDAYLEDGSSLELTKRAMQDIQNSSIVTFEECLYQTPSELYNRAQRSIRQGEEEIFERCKTCLRLLQPYFSYISQLLDALPDI
jgi:tetratricopeptide (TPR) repeat protein